MTEYELKRLDDEIAKLQAKRDLIAKHRRDGGTKIIECLPSCSFEVSDTSVRIEPKGFLKTLIPAYIPPQQEYMFELNADWRLDVNDYGCYLSPAKGKASLKARLDFLRSVGVNKTSIKTDRGMEPYYQEQLASARRAKTALDRAVEEVW